MAGVFLVTWASATAGQCVDYPDRRRKEAESISQLRNPLSNELCDPQTLAAPGSVYRPTRDCEGTLPREQIKEDRAYLESLSQSLVIAAENADKLNLSKVSQWAGEVRKRVRRLKVSLALPEPESAADISTSQVALILSNRVDIARALLVLSRLTSESLRNPVLNGFLLDQTLSAKAFRDFDQIESLAGLIQTSCQILSKASQ